MSRLAGTTIQKLVNLVEKSLLDLKVDSSQEFIESIAILVHEGMSGPHRRFHTTEHVFQVIDPQLDPELVLSALFHDLVYYNVDGGFIDRVKEIVAPYIVIEFEQVFIVRRSTSNDPILPILLNVFGFDYGQALSPSAGLNEFLSALVFAKIFYPILGRKEWLGIIACIEGSQPFRAKDEQGRTCFEVLEARLLKMNRTRGLGFSEDEIINLIKKAVRFANLDVQNFSYESTAEFLDNTWKLLPENNPYLLTNKVYTIKNYRMALEKMEIFFKKINVLDIYHSYKNSPSANELQRMQDQARTNVELAKFYLSGRLLATGLLEALCMSTGGDAPVMMLMGNNSRGNVEPKYEFNDLINKIAVPMAPDINDKVLELLEFEADIISVLDFRKTPLAAFVYKCVGQTKMLQYLVDLKEYFAGRISSDEFLLRIDPYLVKSIAQVCAEMISTRRSHFLSWVKPIDKKRCV